MLPRFSKRGGNFSPAYGAGTSPINYLPPALSPRLLTSMLCHAHCFWPWRLYTFHKRMACREKGLCLLNAMPSIIIGRPHTKFRPELKRYAHDVMRDADIMFTPATASLLLLFLAATNTHTLMVEFTMLIYRFLSVYGAPRNTSMRTPNKRDDAAP